MDSILSQVISKTLKRYLVLTYLALTIKKVRPRKYGQFASCQLQHVNGQDVISKAPTFLCSSTGTSGHRHDVTEIPLKVTLKLNYTCTHHHIPCHTTPHYTWVMCWGSFSPVEKCCVKSNLTFDSGAPLTCISFGTYVATLLCNGKEGNQQKIITVSEQGGITGFAKVRYHTKDQDLNSTKQHIQICFVSKMSYLSFWFPPKGFIFSSVRSYQI